MKQLFWIISTLVISSACGQQGAPSNNEPQKEEHTIAATAGEAPKAMNTSMLFTQADAEKIMGEPSHLKDSSTSMNGDTMEYQCAYIANATDTKSKKTGVIYFMIEEYPDAAPAHEKYMFFKIANEKNGGLKTLEGIGDEAYYHSDNENFYFVLVRKDKRMFRMKVNKITSTTSVDEFNAVTKKVTDLI